MAPLENEEDTRNYLKAFLLTVLSVFIIPLFTLAGYYAKAANHEDKGIPEMEDYAGLTVDGFKVLSAQILVYVIFAFVGAGIASVFELWLIRETAVNIGTVIALPLLLLIPAVTVQIGRNGRFRDIFEKEMYSRVFTLNYLKGLLAIFVTKAVFLFAAFIAVMTIIGILIIPFMHVYRKLVAWRLMGYFYNQE